MCFAAVLFSPSAKKTAAAHALSLAVIPFHNASGDQSWDWLGPSLADMLSTDVGQSAHLRAVSSDRVQQVFHDLRITPNSIVDSSTSRPGCRIHQCRHSGLGTIHEARRPDSHRRDAAGSQTQPHDAGEGGGGESTGSVGGGGPFGGNDPAEPGAVARSGEGIDRRNPSSRPRLRSTRCAITTRDCSCCARETISKPRSSSRPPRKKIPNLPLPIRGWAKPIPHLGYDAEAEQAARHAVDLSQNLPLAQRYFIEASLARVTKDNQKAIAAYENLAKSFPDNLDVQFALGKSLRRRGRFGQGTFLLCERAASRRQESRRAAGHGTSGD